MSHDVCGVDDGGSFAFDLRQKELWHQTVCVTPTKSAALARTNEASTNERNATTPEPRNKFQSTLLGSNTTLNEASNELHKTS